MHGTEEAFILDKPRPSSCQVVTFSYHRLQETKTTSQAL